MMRKNHLIALLFVTMACNTHTMEPEQPSKKWWITYAANVILYSTDALREFLSYVRLEPIAQSYPPESQFASLPKEIQQTIIAFLTARANAATLADGAHAINTLAQVNKQLHELINDPVFCLQIIKSLAQQFDCSNETAAKALQTEEAKHRLAVQKELEKLFTQENFSQTSYNKFYKKYKKYPDSNFTYRSFQQTDDDAKDTLLIIIARGNNYDKKRKIRCLLNTNLINVNYQNKNGSTALMLCAVSCDKPELLKLLVTPININLQDHTQFTALHYACARRRNRFDCIEILLDAGADPEIVAMEGFTPLIIINQYGDNDEIKLIQNAIEKKHEKK